MGFSRWLVASLALHLGFVLDMAAATRAVSPSDVQAASVWFESEPPPLPPVVPAPEPQAAAAPEPTRMRAPKPRAHAPVAAAEGDGTLSVAAAAGPVGSGDSSEQGEAQSAPIAAPAPRPLRERRANPPQLSLWLDLPQLQGMALVRSVTALLVVVPGYREMLLGTNLRPFSDLQRLRVRIDGSEAGTLALGGVHNGGESALRSAAERVAAMRRERPIWRGDAALRATAWVDGSGVARGLAVHDAAFVIAPRAGMPALLGDRDPSGRVGEFSRLRERVLLVAAIEDAQQYVSDLQGCGLAALRVSIATLAGNYRLSLRASYESDLRAGQAAECSRAHAGGQARQLNTWLARAVARPGAYVNELNSGVSHDEIERFLDELGWGLRRSERHSPGGL